MGLFFPDTVQLTKISTSQKHNNIVLENNTTTINAVQQ